MAEVIASDLGSHLQRPLTRAALEELSMLRDCLQHISVILKRMYDFWKDPGTCHSARRVPTLRSILLTPQTLMLHEFGTPGSLARLRR